MFQVSDRLHVLLFPMISIVNKEILHLCLTFNVDNRHFYAWIMINLYLNLLIFKINFILHSIIDNHLSLNYFLHSFHLLMLSFQFFFQLFFTIYLYFMHYFYLYLHPTVQSLLHFFIYFKVFSCVH